MNSIYYKAYLIILIVFGILIFIITSKNAMYSSLCNLVSYYQSQILAINFHIHLRQNELF